MKEAERLGSPLLWVMFIRSYSPGTYHLTGGTTIGFSKMMELALNTAAGAE
ncbi:MAG: hypothetical protein ACRC36_22200 [Lacrimispora sphenoides]